MTLLGVRVTMSSWRISPLSLLILSLWAFSASAQDGSPCTECACAGDRDGDGTVTVDEAVEVVGNLLDGCRQLQWHERCLFVHIRGHEECPETMHFCTTEELDAPCREDEAPCCRAESRCTNANCNSSLECTDHDPSPVACRLRSRRQFKHDIEYLGQGDLEQLRSKLLQMNLTRFRYNGQPSSTAPHLGFIIEDVEPSPSVDVQNDAVDLYGYISMAVATIQVQNREIQKLQQQMHDLRRQMGQPDANAAGASDNQPSQPSAVR